MSRRRRTPIEGERTRPEGRLVISAPFGLRPAACQSGSSTAYLKRYPDVGVDLRLSDRRINLVEDGVDLAVRIGHLPDSTLVARHVGQMRRIVVASPRLSQGSAASRSGRRT